jgi:hypothetical protein
MNWVIAVIAFLAVLAVVRHWAIDAWRSGRMSSRQVAIAISLVWAAFPFVGLATGAPWSIPVVLFGSTVVFVTGVLSTEWLLKRVKRSRG